MKSLELNSESSLYKVFPTFPGGKSPAQETIIRGSNLPHQSLP